MNILVINVAMRPQSPVKLFPIGLGYIATAIKRAGFDFDLLDIDVNRYTDEEVESLIRQKKYDVVCMGCIVTGYKIIKNLSAIIKKYHPGSKIIVGNSVATSIPEILLTKTEADIAVMGEGDESIEDLLQTLLKSKPLEEVKGIVFIKAGQMHFTPSRPLINDISSLPHMDFDIFDIEAYIEHTRPFVSDPLPIPREEIRALPVNVARGCVANCGFCYHVFMGMKYRFRSPQSVMEEINDLQKRYGVNYILFHDELTFFSKKYAQDFAKEIIDKNMHFYWAACCRGDLFQKEEDVKIIEKLRKAGCLGLAFSLESADPQILKSMNKHLIVEQFSRQVELCRKAGMNVWTSLVLGYPQETPETIKKTMDVCIENKIYPSAGYLLPQPGSPIYSNAIKEGFIQDEEEYLLKMGDRQDLRLNMTKMSDEEFESQVREGLKRCSEAMGIGLKDEELIKTLFYRSTTSE